MDRYTLYCTEVQTRKALELGAPIEMVGVNQRDTSRPVYYTDNPKENLECDAYYCPTAEQMISWLEEQLPLGMDICIESNMLGHWNYFLGVKDGNQFLNSRKEATLVAIDAALEYLTNKKK